MTRNDVSQMLESFLSLLQREQELKEELLSLKMFGNHATADDVTRKVVRHADLLAEIGRLRTEEMLPILEYLASFISMTRMDRVA